MLPGHLTVLPVVLPLVVAAILLLLDERERNLKASISAISTVLLMGIAFTLLIIVDSDGGPGMAVYRVGDWAVPFGIVLVIDRLSALMLALTSIVALAALGFAVARWHRAGPHFHTLFQLLLAGLNGAFLTGDLFNLFVFFEVLLAASYGLVLHGSGPERVKAGMHYIAVNLAGSMLLLIGISLMYGVTGTLNMADLAARVPALAGDERALAEAAGGVLGIAFLIKAGAWPLCFWLPTAYAAAAAPVAAMFAIMSKVGIYVILRLWLLVFGPETGTGAQFGGDWLLFAGLLTIVFGMIGALAAQPMTRLAGYGVLVSSGTLLAVIGTGNHAAVGGALFYLVSSTLAIAAFFLLIELVQRNRDPEGDDFLAAMETFGDEDEMEPGEEEIGIAIPGTIAILGLAFIGCALVFAGLPPLSGFIAKFAILTALLNPGGLEGGATEVSGTTWAVVTLLIVSGLALLIAMTRAGIRVLWVQFEEEMPRVRAIEIMAVGFLLILCFGMTLRGGPIMRYMDDTARSIGAPENYIRGVLTVPGTAMDTEGGARW